MRLHVLAASIRLNLPQLFRRAAHLLIILTANKNLSQPTPIHQDNKAQILPLRTMGVDYHTQLSGTKIFKERKSIDRSHGRTKALPESWDNPSLTPGVVPERKRTHTLLTAHCACLPSQHRGTTVQPNSHDSQAERHLARQDGRRPDRLRRRHRSR